MTDITSNPEYIALQEQLAYLEDAGMEHSPAGRAVRAKLELLRASYQLKLSPQEVKP